MSKPKILLIDIETKPLLSYFWRMFDEQGGTAMLVKDWSILSWSAKWLDEDKVMYSDQRNAKDIENEKKMLEPLRELLDQADIVIGHNSKKFDVKRINARLIKHKIPRPSPYRQIDTLQIAKKHFDFTSNKLEYLANYLGCKMKKMVQRKFNGINLWIQCLAGNKEAWREMEAYNKQDVRVLEEVYKRLREWDDSINFSVYNGGDHLCSCGSTKLIRKGLAVTNAGVYQRFKCKDCGRPYKGKENLLSPEQRKNMKRSCS